MNGSKQLVANIRIRTAQPTRSVLCCTLFSFTASVMAEEKFNTDFIRGVNNAVLAETLANGANILSGTYPFDIYLNNQLVAQRDVAFTHANGGGATSPCLSAAEYQEFGVSVDPWASIGQPCFDLAKNLEGVRVNADPNTHRLDLQVPQTHLIPRPQGHIPSSTFDRGITAAFLNYTFNGARSTYRRSGQTRNGNYHFTNLNAGLNAGSWRLRGNATLTKQQGAKTSFERIGSWAETDIVPWRSRFVIGESVTRNSVFEGFGFRGIQLSSATDMLPESMRGYAPVVRGVATGTARVEIRQNGYTIYSTRVPPGPFEIRDIYPSSLGGNLHVSVIEADGTRSEFDVPFSAVPNMLRDGIWDYQLTVGTYRDNIGSYRPQFGQMTASRGMPGDLTVYGGILATSHYHSAVLGAGRSFGQWGALSFDVAGSDTDLASGEHRRGQSYRLLYANTLNSLGTEFRIAGYRYSTSGYFDFPDAVAERSRWEDGLYRYDVLDMDASRSGGPAGLSPQQRSVYTSQFGNKRQRLDISVNQRIGQGSTLYANVSNQSYWGSHASDRTMQIGYNSQYQRMSYGLFLQKTSNSFGYEDRSVNLTMSIPLGSPSSSGHTTSNSQYGYSKQGGQTASTGVSGTLLEDKQLNYSAQTNYSDQGGTGATLNLGYQGSKGNLETGYSYNRHYQEASIGVSGGLVVHADGVTLSRPLHGSAALVKAPDAKGVRLENQTGTAIDGKGYAVVSSIMPYRHNRIALRTEDIGQNLDIPHAVKSVVPTSGAIVRVEFETHKGQSVLVRSQLPDGTTLPVGASVYDAEGKTVGIVGIRGEAYVSGVANDDQLLVKWGAGQQQACTLLIEGLADDPIETAAPGYRKLSLGCRPEVS